MKTVLARLLTLAMVWSAGSAAAQDSLRIAAVVNEDVISVYDLATRMSLVLASSNLQDTPDVRRRLAPQVLRGLIDEKLKMQEARRLDIRVDDEDIDGALTTIAKQNGVPLAEMDAVMAKQGINKGSLIHRIESEIAWARVVGRRFSNTIRVGEEEIDEALAEIEQSKGKHEHRVAEIFLPVDNPAQEEEVRVLSERMIQQIRAGADFAALAQSFSQSAAAAVGGDLGWVRPGQLAPEIDSILATMKPGQVARPIRSLSGYHIVLLIDRRSGVGLGEPEVTVTLQQLFVPLSANAGPAEAGGQVQLARTMAETAKDCADMERLSRESGSPLSGSLGTVSLSKLPADIREAVGALPVGTASEPIRSDRGFLVLMVCERHEQDRVADLRNSIKDRLMDRRIGAAARRYLRDLRRAAFVDVRI